MLVYARPSHRYSGPVAGRKADIDTPASHPDNGDIVPIAVDRGTDRAIALP